MKPVFAALMLAGAIHSLPVAAAPAPSGPTAAAPANAASNAVPLELRNGRLFIDAAINGHETRALLDSGAELTVVDTRYARQIGLTGTSDQVMHGSGGTTKAQFVDGVTLDIAGHHLTDLTVAIIDLSDVSRRLNGAPIEMIAGREIFDADRWAIDLEQGRMTAVPRDRTPAGTLLPLTGEHGIEMMPVSIEGHAPALAAFDLGNGSGVMVGKAYADQIGLLADGRPTSTAKGGGLGGAIDRTMITLRTLGVGGRTFSDVPAAIDTTDRADAANIGTSILRAFRITVDFAEHKLWLDPIAAEPSAR